MLDDIRKKLPNYSCRAFWPIAGLKYGDEGERLMFAGQAVGAWGVEGVDPDDDAYRAWFSPKRPAALSGIEAYSITPETEGGCPLEWFGGIRGHFRNAVATLCNSQRGWASRIAWTNLYKVAQNPRGRGNPDDPLCDVQFDSCRKLFREELRHYRPTCTFVLAGRIWYEPFFEPGEQVLERTRTRNVAAFRTKDDDLIVVAPHPRTWCLMGLTFPLLRAAISEALRAVATKPAERDLAARLGKPMPSSDG
ncbi:MAG: hypothetical protein MUC36_03750 [Planctomycetes bacterium]|nr:hypothetical protein [Planctomycetota bacterium]